MDDAQNIYQLFTACKTEREQYTSLWQDIQNFVGIQVDVNYTKNPVSATKSRQLDEYIDDPTAATSVNQQGDYICGLMWGNGANVFDIRPSRYVTELVEAADVEDFYAFATDQTLYHMNHPDAGYTSALQPYAYDQAAFGTSGIGIFPNQAFKRRTEENALIARNYGPDNLAVDEGKNGMIEIVFATYQWKVNRIVGEFCMRGGKLDPKRFAKLPKAIKDAYNNNNFNTVFTIVFGFFPRDDYDPKFEGTRGTRYRGVWFMDDPKDCKPFFEESFSEKPIPVTRQIKVRGEVWGRSSGTMLLSTIRSVNFMLSCTIEIIEKMGNPALGITSNAIFGDSVLDTSPNGLTVFNSLLANGQAPTFPIHDVGDPSGIVKFILPYLNEKITTAFKVDALLDFNNAKEMTAREALQRYAIRGQALSGMLGRQKNERLVPDVRRAISILYEMGELGVDPTVDPKRANALIKRNLAGRVIPEAVLQVIKSGRPWYELTFNNELEKLTRTETVQNLVQVLNAITAISAVFPDIIHAVDWYKLLKDINDNLDYNNQILISDKEFKKVMAQISADKRAAMMLQAGQAGAATMKDAAQANKNNAEAANAKG